MVIDVAKTYATRNPVVVSSFKWKIPEGWHFYSGVALSALDGKHVLFFDVSASIFKFVEGCNYGYYGPVAVSTDPEAVSQLSSTQLCISKSNTVEIWDCNSNSTEPLRVIERILQPDLLNPPVIAESGFLFHQSVNQTGGAQDGDDDELKVTDLLGNVVVTLKMLPGWWQTPYHDFSVSGFIIINNTAAHLRRVTTNTAPLGMMDSGIIL
ncbi:hypothetical protein Pelo_19672 [Pelomyxa schiedti]|nr:hypothetical protein Pelo_19672 [Pelomyxa schiedti]